MSSQEARHELLRQAIELARTGDKTRARDLLERVLREDEYNELAWMWMAAVVEHSAERREALEIVLEINPDNQRARDALEKLGGPRARRKAEAAQTLAERLGDDTAGFAEADFQPVVARPPEPAPEPDPPPDDPDAERLLELARGDAPPAAPPATVSESDLYDFERAARVERLARLRQTIRRALPIVLIAAAVVAVIAAAVTLGAPLLEELTRPQPTATITPALETALAEYATAPPGTPTATPDTGLVVVTLGGAEASAMPPTWTPSHTPTATASHTPTPTANPPASYRLVFVRRDDGEARYSLYTANGDGSDERRLTDDGTNERDPVIGPDGLRILYVSDQRGGRELVLRDIPVDPTPTPLALPTETLSPDPTTGEVGAAPSPAPTQAPIPPAVDVVTGYGSGYAGSPSWSADGFRIVFSADFDGDEEIYITNLSGTSLTRLTDNEGIDRDPAWSPDGSRIVFASDRDGAGELELYSIRPDGTDLVRLTNSAGSSTQPAWSPDGAYIVFVSDRDRDADLYIMNADGTNERLLTRDDDGAEDRAPAWSPDGRWIAFSSTRESANFQLYLIDPSGETVVRVTNSSGDDLDPAWQ